MISYPHISSFSPLFSVLLAFAMLVSGCGTLFQGSKQEVRIQSDPTGADVEVRGQPKGKTPVTLTLNRGQTHLVEITHEGYERYNVTLTKEPKILWFIGGPFAAIDHATGALYKLDPGSVSANLEEK
jgi:hypothetical protein